ncbi:MAG: hypothetical protein ABI601_04510 [bacterium]
MSEPANTIVMSALVGRTVRDHRGRALGRIVELVAEVQLHRSGNDYVVTRIVIGRYGSLDLSGIGQLVPCAGDRWRHWAGYRRYEIPWDQFDLRDPEHPRVQRGVGDV